MEPTPAALRDRVEAWIADDPDPRTRRDLQALLVARAYDRLAELFSGPLDFGTAGLRGVVGPGESRMNEATVARAAAGVARQVLADVPDARQRGVVIGRDARRGSERFAQVTAEVMVGHGLRVRTFVEPVPTPLAAWAGRHFDAAATVVVTASHNPPQYNGFKVFSERGSQIVAPQDARIRAAMDEAGPLEALPRVPLDEAAADGRLEWLDGTIGEAWLGALDAQCVGDQPPPASVRVVTTALHGVGHRWVEAALRRRGFEDLHPVVEQAEPDGAFPTVRFPNPEEPGALDLALALAAKVEADLIVANDPDTDRLCVAYRRRSGDFEVLTGNDTGILLADWLLRRRQDGGTLEPGSFVVTTIVSTSMLARVAEAYGADADETLTGFKWIWDRALAREAEGDHFVFGFEEALGYCVGPVVRDKDGVGAAQAILGLAASLKADGLNLGDRRDALAVAHGLHATRQVATVLPGAAGKARIAAIMTALRADPPTEIADAAVESARDGLGDARGALPPGDVLTWWLEDGSRVIFRPSGTEPKLKSYLEVRVEVDGADGIEQARQRAEARLDALEAWVQRVLRHPAIDEEGSDGG